MTAFKSRPPLAKCYGMKSWWVLEGPLTDDGGSCEAVREHEYVSLARALEEYGALPAPKRNALRSWGWSKEMWAPYSGRYVKLKEWRFSGDGVRFRDAQLEITGDCRGISSVLCTAGDIDAGIEGAELFSTDIREEALSIGGIPAQTPWGGYVTIRGIDGRAELKRGAIAEYVVPALCDGATKCADIMGRLEELGLRSSYDVVNCAVGIRSIKRVRRGEYKSAY